MSRPLSTGMKRLLLVASALVFLAGFQLFILSEYTDSYFAWTIQPPLTAAFLGAGYFSSFLLEFFAAREKQWSRARIAVPAVFAFTTLTLVATLLHVDRFHFNDPNIFAQAAAWFWLLIYAVVPPAMLMVWARQQRMPGKDDDRTAILPLAVRMLLSVQSILMLAVGIGLFLLPNQVAPFWPWKLTALTSRAVGAWLVGIGIYAMHAVKENDGKRIRSGSTSYLALGVLQLIALARYPGNVDWSRLVAWFYVAFVIGILLVGLAALSKKRDVKTPTARTVNK